MFSTAPSRFVLALVTTPPLPFIPFPFPAANYFPTNCLIKTSSSNVTLAVAVDRSEGSSSLTNGQLELMVHRRLMHDDGECGRVFV